MENVFVYKRKSYIELGKIFFWTATIYKWQKILENDKYKNVIISSLEHLSYTGKIDVLSFVIMPNHVHFIWRINKNGKESTHGSFLKYTAHEFKKMLKKEEENKLIHYAIEANNKRYEFWQRDPLAIPIYTKDVAFQKLEYIHNNPLAKHWRLAIEPWNYKYSTAGFYEMGIKEFSFIKDLRDEF